MKILKTIKNKINALNTSRGAVFGIESRALKKQFGELFLERIPSLASVETGVRHINTSRGAVFGIDARIALVILSIASLAIALNKLSVDESAKLKDSTFKILKLSDHILEQYSIYHDDISNIETIYSASNADQDKFWSKNSSLKYDAWGNQWQFIVRSGLADNIKAYGKQIAPKCIIIFSAGADGYHYLHDNYTSTTYADCINNTGLPSSADYTEKHDDLFYKFTTIDYEINANEKVEQYLSKIQQALNNYSQAEYNIRVKYCDEKTLADANIDPLCDVDSNGTYLATELESVNYYPKSSLDLTAGVVYSDSTVYNFNNVADRESFLTRIGLPKAYNEDPLGRALYYNSNLNATAINPFVAQFKYAKCPACSFN